VAEHFVGYLSVAIGILAHRVITPFALVALVTVDREGDDDTVAYAEFAFRAYSHFDHFAHRLMAKDISRFHARHEPAVEVKVRSANAGACDPDDGIARMLNRGIRNVVATNVLFAVPYEGFHKFYGLDFVEHFQCSGPLH
jgi:predicted cobalt transporter CbtA